MLGALTAKIVQVLLAGDDAESDARRGHIVIYPERNAGLVRELRRLVENERGIIGDVDFGHP